MSTGTTDPVLSVESVTAGYGVAFRSPHVLHDVSLSVRAGQTLGVVGESGSGKSTLARVIAGQLNPLAGTVRLDGRSLAGLPARERRVARRQIQLIPQDPYASLDPQMTIGHALAEAIDPGRMPRRVDPARIRQLLEAVALDADSARRRPHEFSGGQRQRIAIARALAVSPRVIVADEITSALDVSVQAEVLNLVLELQRESSLTVVFITHDLAAARYMCDELAVLYLGRIVEHGRTDILAHPTHPYTELLRDSVPETSGRLLDTPSAAFPAEADDPANPPPGCPFHPRCAYGPQTDTTRRLCATEIPALTPREGPDLLASACHFPLPQTAAAT